jgi:hypothetical protein
MWYTCRRFPRVQWLRQLHPVMICVGGLLWAPYNFQYMWPAVPVPDPLVAIHQEETPGVLIDVQLRACSGLVQRYRHLVHHHLICTSIHQQHCVQLVGDGRLERGL